MMFSSSMFKELSMLLKDNMLKSVQHVRYMLFNRALSWYIGIKNPDTLKMRVAVIDSNSCMQLTNVNIATAQGIDRNNINNIKYLKKVSVPFTILNMKAAN